ncbi:MAG: helix-turn-helix domain-containing protein [Ktedonobacterales bacterium]
MSDEHDTVNDIDEYIATLSGEERDELAIADLALELAWLLHQARLNRGMSQAEAAARAGLHQQAVSRLERSLGHVRLSTLERYLDALGYTLRVEVTEKSTGAVLGATTIAPA